MTNSMIPCAHCGGEIRADASFCRHCGSSDSDGWRSDDESASEFDDFDYDQYVEDHFPESRDVSSLTNTQTRPLWRFVAVMLLLLFAIGYLLL